MTKRIVAFLLVSGICLGLAACSGAPSTKQVEQVGLRPADLLPPPPKSKRAGEAVCYGVYHTLKAGGSLYAGTVLSVTIQGDDPLGDSVEEWGEIRFRVDRVLAGPPQGEMIIPYWWHEDRLGEGGGGGLMMADWGGGSPWPTRPEPGEHLLLLLSNEKESEKLWENRLHPVHFRWEVAADNPLVDGFAVACRYLTAKDAATQDDLYCQLCESPYQNMHEFALNAAFEYLGHDTHGPEFADLGDPGYSVYGGDYDPVRQSQLALAYLKHAGPRLTAQERLSVTGSFAEWFGWGRQERVTDELKRAFEDWYIKEMSVKDDMQRPKQALLGLEQLIRSNDVPATIALFKKIGRAGLVQRVKDCDPAGDPEMEKLRKELLTKLDAP